jgi:hypothetical protein
MQILNRVIFNVTLLFLIGVSSASATVYFKIDLENFEVNTNLYQNGNSTINPPFYFLTHSGTTIVRQSPNVNIGKYLEKFIPARTHDSLVYHQNNVGNSTYGEVAYGESNPTTLSTGAMHYLAFLVNMDRMGSANIWSSSFSANKGVNLHGPNNVIRAGVGFGFYDWENFRADKYTIILKCNGGTDFNNGSSGAYGDNNYSQNQNGFNRTNNFYLDYERWYSVVFGVQFSTTNSGKVRWWVNGTLIASYDNVRTASGAPSFDYIENWGTIAQDGYNCPNHKENFEKIIFTNSINDINGTNSIWTNGGFNFFADPEIQGDSPAPPKNLKLGAQ